MEIEKNKSYKIFDSKNASRVVKAHVMHIVDGCYENEKLIVYRFFGKHKRWWWQCLMTKEDFIFAIELANMKKNRNEIQS